MANSTNYKQNKLLLASFFILLFAQNIDAQSRSKYRTIDGSNNNLNNTTWGAARIPLFRELPAEYADGKNTLAGASRPNTRAISNKLSDEPEDQHNKRGMSGLFYIWGQFIDHDITSTPTGTEKAPISLPSDEKKFSNPISFTRSAAFPGTGVTTPREQMNESNSWIDASQVYGNDDATAKWLRTFKNGKLWVSKGNLLPFNTNTREESGTLDPTAPKMDDDNGRTKKTFVAGDHRAAEHPGLTSLHTLFVREHNRICDRLISQGYSNDETIYQMARKEVGALIQHITYTQWLSALGISLKTYSGYNASVRPDIMNTFASAAYRWHTMVENDIIFRDNECHGVGPSELPLKDVFFNIGIVRKYDIGVLLKGLSIHRQYETDLKVNNGLRNFLFGTLGTDLVAINLQRGRDHGLPNYNTVRKFYTGSSASSFYDISSDASTASKMQSLYGSVNNVDLWVGLFAEPHLPGKSVGKTLDAIIRAQFEKLRDGDYYFYMNDPELSNTRSMIQSTKLSDVISRNSNAGNFQENVFFRKSCSSSGDDIAHYSCSVTPQYDGWTYLGKTGSKTYYKWNGGNATFEEAKRIAQRLGGHLPQIANATENNTIKAYIASGTAAWLDLNRNGLLWQNSGVFDVNDVLIPGAFSYYFNWRLGEPNNVGGIENRVQIGSDGKWNDISESALQTVIAEVPCETNCSLDGTPPVFTSVPSNISVGIGLLTLCKPVFWTAPTASDECGFVSVIQTSGYPNGSCLFPGTYTVGYTATDLKGNKSYCSFTINVYKTLGLFLQNAENLALEVQAEPTRAQIQWVNNTGFKNDYFTLEKMNNTSGEFEKLEIVNNQSNDNSVTDYVAYDNAPYDGDNTYRVVITFKDGSTKISEPKTVKFSGSSDIKIFPNPANDVISVDLTNYKNAENVEINMYNQVGQLMLTQKVTGSFNPIVELNVDNQQTGIYLIRISSKGKKNVMKKVSIAH